MKSAATIRRELKRLDGMLSRSAPPLDFADAVSAADFRRALRWALEPGGTAAPRPRPSAMLRSAKPRRGES